jgi:Uma2 family endonuclease
MVTVASTVSVKTQPLLLDVSNTTLTVTPEQFDRLCIDNPDLRLELTPDRELIVMAPAGGESGEKNGDLFLDVGIWNRQTNLGRSFDSSTGYDFIALGGGKLSPDVSWIEKSRLEDVNIVGFIPVVPDFVIELRSATDNLKPLQKKMREYQRLGVRLGLLVDPKNKRVEIYRGHSLSPGESSLDDAQASGQEPEILESPTEIDCGDVMPGFVLSMSRIF